MIKEIGQKDKNGRLNTKDLNIMNPLKHGNELRCSRNRLFKCFGVAYCPISLLND
jgi:hypothetical protein